MRMCSCAKAIPEKKSHKRDPYSSRAYIAPCVSTVDATSCFGQEFDAFA